MEWTAVLVACGIAPSPAAGEMGLSCAKDGVSSKPEDPSIFPLLED